jgi:hypothetical protein
VDDVMTDCIGCKKLQNLHATAYQRGKQSASLQYENELKLMQQYLYVWSENWKKEKDEIQQLMTQAIQEAEDRADYWEDKYRSIT